MERRGRREAEEMQKLEVFTGRKMRLFCRAATKTVEIESMETLLKTWREREGGTFLTKVMNGSEDGRYTDEADPERRNVGIGVSGDGD